LSLGNEDMSGKMRTFGSPTHAWCMSCLSQMIPFVQHIMALRVFLVGWATDSAPSD
jgi:hypothetical protein